MVGQTDGPCPCVKSNSQSLRRSHFYGHGNFRAMFEKRGILTLWLFKDKNKGAGEVVQGLGTQTTLQRTRVLVPVQFYSQAAHNHLCSSSRGSRTFFWPQYTLVHVHMYVETRVKLKIYILERQTKESIREMERQRTGNPLEHKDRLPCYYWF